MNNSYILNIATPSTPTIAGIIDASNSASVDQTNRLIVTEAKDLESLSNSQLTVIYNIAAKTPVKALNAAKSVNANRVFKVLSEMDIETLVKLDKAEEVIVEKAAEKITESKVATDGVKPVRNSMLQRVKKLFESKNESGQYRELTLADIMREGSDASLGQEVTLRIAKQYISILRSQSDRFVMRIVKNKTAGTYQYNPK